eukprot:3068265-Prymnesium_polylepis.1
MWYVARAPGPVTVGNVERRRTLWKVFGAALVSPVSLRRGERAEGEGALMSGLGSHAPDGLAINQLLKLKAKGLISVE